MRANSPATGPVAPASKPKPKGLRATDRRKKPASKSKPAAKPSASVASDAPPKVAKPKLDLPKFGVPSAETIKATVAKHYKTVQVLAELEANEMRDTLIKALKGACETADEGISLSNRKGAEAKIWRTIDDEEIGVIADYLIEQGKQHAAAAALVRSTVDLWKRWNIALILGPRLWDTGKFYQDNGFGFGGGKAS